MQGDRLGKWILMRELGRGGMGRVYLAREEGTGRHVALKVLSGHHADDPGFLDRFQREIESLRQLDHPHIVRLFESGQELGSFYYAMEYLEGASLFDVLRKRKRLPWEEVLHIGWQMCRALRHVHERGIIHRDLKPSNLLLAEDGSVKLTDFGIAKLFAATQLTATGGVVGTADYLSPEQAAGKPVSPRSDIYSLGVVLYELLAGRPPFVSNSVPELLQKHRYSAFDAPRKFVPDLPADFNDLLCQMLEKSPDERPADCTAVGKRLERIGAKYGKEDPALEEWSKRPTLADQQTVQPARRSSKSDVPVEAPTSRPWLGQLPVLVALLAVCLGILAWTFWPASQETLFREGSALMASDRLSDMERAWSAYLGPLERRFPNHPYRLDLDRFRKQLEEGREPRLSEAGRFVRKAQRLLDDGKPQEALQLCRLVEQVFGPLEGERYWVDKAKKMSAEQASPENRAKRLERLQPLLERASALKEPERGQYWTQLKELYRGDALEGEVHKAIQRQP